MKKKVIIGIISIVIIVSFFSGCTNEDEETTPIITSFTVDPNEIEYGETANLFWTVENADTASIDNAIGTVSLEGTRIIQPSYTTIYKLTATKSGNTVIATTQIIVDTSTITAPSIQFTKDGTAWTLTVAQADPTDIDWADFTITKSTGTEYTTLSFGLTGTVNAGDTLNFTPYGVGTYSIRYDPTNTLMGQWTFVNTNEDETTSPKITLFKAEPNIINYFETANLIWTVENADTVTIDNGIGTISLTGTRIVQPLFTTTYTLTASKSGNTASVSTIVIVNVSPVPTPSIQFSKDGTQRTLMVVHAEPTNTNWADFTITNSTGTEYTTLSFGLTGTVNAGDILNFSAYGAETWNIRYDPTNTLMGSWTFV